MLFRARLEAWGPGVGRHVGDAWREKRSGLLWLYVEPVVGHLELEELRSKHVVQIQNNMIALGLAPRTINRTLHGALPAFLRDAEIDELLPEDFGRRLLSKRRVARIPERRAKNRTPYPHAERDAILDAIRTGDQSWGLGVAAFNFCVGLRPSELCGLRWPNICTVRRFLDVVETRGEYDDEDDPGDGKTEDSQRGIQIPRMAVAALAGFPRTAEGYVFLSPKGYPLDWHNWAARVWRPACLRAGVQPRPPVVMRHTAISYRLMAGDSPTEVAQYFGNSPAVIWKHYYAYIRNVRGKDLDAALHPAPVPQAPRRSLPSHWRLLRAAPKTPGRGPTG